MAENFNIETNDEVENFVVEFGEVVWVTNNDFNKLNNRPSYAGETMTGETDIPEVPDAVSDLTNDADYQTGTEVEAAIGVETQARQEADDALGVRIDAVAGDLVSEESARRIADNGLQTQIDAITASSDVVDIVGTYAELQNYPTTGLGDNDVIKVLQDSTHNDAMSYYRWSVSTSTWSYIGSEGPYYTKSEANSLLGAKQNQLTAGDNIQIDDDVISATNTTYTAGNGINISAQNVISTDAPEGFFTLPATVEGEGSEITLNNTIGAKLDDLQVDGDTYQQTYSGFQLLQAQGLATPSTDSTFWDSFSNLTQSNEEDGWVTLTSTSASVHNMFIKKANGFNWSTGTTYTVILEVKNAPSAGYIALSQPQNVGDPFESTSVGGQVTYNFTGQNDIVVFSGVTKNTATSYGMRMFLNQSFTSSVTLRLTIVAGDHTADYQNYIGDNWEPYVGGISVPNPEYPQEIQTVTGEQTVIISDNGEQSESYPISLGSIELCKIGDYQDYIYKSGDDWYVHKETAKMVLSGGETDWTFSSGSAYPFRLAIANGDNFGPSQDVPPIVFTNYYTPFAWNTPAADRPNYGITTYIRTGEPTNVATFRNIDITSLADWKTWLSTHNTAVYYPLATPTDTQITDATLVGQLGTLWNAMSYNGQTNFAVTASDSGALPAILEVKAYQKSLNGLLGVIERMSE